MKSTNEQIADEAMKSLRSCLKNNRWPLSHASVQLKENRHVACYMRRIGSCVLHPKLYKHLRKQKILVLPSRTCLQRHVRNIKSGFGFNDTVFKALSAKTETPLFEAFKLRPRS